MSDLWSNPCNFVLQFLSSDFKRSSDEWWLDQPLLLEELLEQEKREQEKQQQQQQVSQVDVATAQGLTSPMGNNMISDLELEHLVLNSPSGQTSNQPKPQMPVAQSLPGQVMMQPQLRPPFPPRPVGPMSGPVAGTPGNPSVVQPGVVGSLGPVNVGGMASGQIGLQQPVQQWVQRPQIVRPPTQPMAPQESRVPLFSAPRLVQPPSPPENIASEADKQAHLAYDHWLNHENQYLADQLKYYETEVHKLRKARKSLISKKRVAMKHGNELHETDAAELQRITEEQSGLQKHLDSARKANRQHNSVIQ
ncbi:hypothetical protein FOCC_FOCC010758, partial [Frankliniella occidentalis]